MRSDVSVHLNDRIEGKEKQKQRLHEGKKIMCETGPV